MNHPHAPRRAWLRHTFALAAAGALPVLARAAAPATTSTANVPADMEVWKDPNCGCCKDWVAHMQAAGFRVGVHDMGNTAVRQRLGLPAGLGSCHTALVGGYVIEGHVPAADVRRLLREKPQALGLAVPGMPVGSPGMDGALYGGRRDAFDVLLVAPDGSTRVFQHHPGNRQEEGGNGAQPATDAHAGHGAQDAPHDDGAAAAGAGTDAEASEGEVVRWDAATARLTLRHGEIRNLGMAPMTMVFRVREPVEGLNLAPGQRVRFVAERTREGLVARRIQPIASDAAAAGRLR